MGRGFYSKNNIENVLAIKIKVICEVFKDNAIRNILLSMDRCDIYSRGSMVSLKNTPIYIK